MNRVNMSLDELIKQSKKQDKKKAADKKKVADKKAVQGKKGLKVGGAKATLKKTVAKKKKEKDLKDAVKQNAKSKGAKKTESPVSKKAKKVATLTMNNKQKREAQLKSRRGITTDNGKSGPLISSTAYNAAIQKEAAKIAKAMIKKDAKKVIPVATKKKNNNNGNMQIQFDVKKFSETITKSLAAQLKSVLNKSPGGGKKNNGRKVIMR